MKRWKEVRPRQRNSDPSGKEKRSEEQTRPDEFYAERDRGIYRQEGSLMRNAHIRAGQCNRSAIEWVELCFTRLRTSRVHTSPSASWSDQKSHGVKVVEVNPVRFQPRWYHRPTEYVYPRCLLLAILFIQKPKTSHFTAHISTETFRPAPSRPPNVNRLSIVGIASQIAQIFEEIADFAHFQGEVHLGHRARTA